MKLDQAISKLLYDKRITPNALAESAGLRPNVVYSAIKGGNVTMKSLKAIAKGLKMPVWKIVKLAEELSK